MDNDIWSKFSLHQAMRGLEDDGVPEYLISDLKEKYIIWNLVKLCFLDFR